MKRTSAKRDKTTVTSLVGVHTRHVQSHAVRHKRVAQRIPSDRRQYDITRNNVCRLNMYYSSRMLLIQKYTDS